jgi:hypothetical protein
MMDMGCQNGSLSGIYGEEPDDCFGVRYEVKSHERASM